jgi:hypothetical protein
MPSDHRRRPLKGNDVSGTLDIALRTALIGIGATLVLDLWSLFLKAAFHLPFPNYVMVGRWIGGIPSGRLVSEDVAKEPAVAGERAIGWTAHYAIGVLFAVLLVAIVGVDWLSAPTLAPALIIGVATVAAPLFVMQPAMGSGIASSKSPRPNLARARSLLAHTAFGIGLYLTAAAIALISFGG